MNIYKKTQSLQVTEGSITTPVITLTKERGAVILGKILFPNASPVFNATVLLSYLDPTTQAKIPVAFTFTNPQGEFMFGIQDTSKTYSLNIQYVN
ncbi:MAG: hypothetical protein ACRC1P_04425 [Cellulosilyticaceae bacterium]